MQLMEVEYLLADYFKISQGVLKLLGHLNFKRKGENQKPKNVNCRKIIIHESFS
jgi:hypothetical protein